IADMTQVISDSANTSDDDEVVTCPEDNEVEEILKAETIGHARLYPSSVDGPQVDGLRAPTSALEPEDGQVSARPGQSEGEACEGTSKMEFCRPLFTIRNDETVEPRLLSPYAPIQRIGRDGQVATDL
ncbi:MAG: hypothetical protein ACRDRT_06700, partial [Pseudonocardiaceae bacterium]